MVNSFEDIPARDGIPRGDSDVLQTAVAPAHAVFVRGHRDDAAPQRVLLHRFDRAALHGLHAAALLAGIVRAVVGAPVAEGLAVDKLAAAEGAQRFSVCRPGRRYARRGSRTGGPASRAGASGRLLRRRGRLRGRRRQR